MGLKQVFGRCLPGYHLRCEPTYMGLKLHLASLSASLKIGLRAYLYGIETCLFPAYLCFSLISCEPTYMGLKQALKASKEEATRVASLPIWD